MRKPLPERRKHLHFDHEWPATSLRPFKVSIGVGFYDDGRPGEAFLVSGKSGESLEANARDGAILFSIALQYGATLAEIRNAISREETGEAASMLGSCIDRIAKEIGDV